AARRRGEDVMPPATHESHVLVLRHANEVNRHVLAPVAFALLSALAEGLCVNDALERVCDSEGAAEEVAAQLMPWFSYWTANGFFQTLME
ncbi:MAG: hypothetical protein K2Q01_02250, partial [Rickettsiales bacterium]|nr:hypothetical protein [Rickettsiales bacterium]